MQSDAGVKAASLASTNAADCGLSEGAVTPILLGDGMMEDKDAARRVLTMAASNVKTDGPPVGDAAAAGREDDDEDDGEEEDEEAEEKDAEEEAGGGDESLAGELGNASAWVNDDADGDGAREASGDADAGALGIKMVGDERRPPPPMPLSGTAEKSNEVGRRIWLAVTRMLDRDACWN